MVAIKSGLNEDAVNLICVQDKIRKRINNKYQVPETNKFVPGRTLFFMAIFETRKITSQAITQPFNGNQGRVWKIELSNKARHANHRL